MNIPHGGRALAGHARRVAIAILLLHLPVLADGRGLDAQTSSRGSALVHLNGELLEGLVAIVSDNGESLVAVDALIRAIDGEQAPGTARIRRDGSRLYAAGVGACDDCPIGVARPVLISKRVRTVDGVPMLPLADLVAALEGRVTRHHATGTWEIFAGKCTWCILEPR